jgi:hypothetical protein
MNQRGQAGNLRRVMWGVALLTFGCLISGCRVASRPSPAEKAADLAVLLPAQWTTLGRTYQVNLREPDATSSLLLFRFDMGQIGAVIVEGTPPTPTRVDWLLPRHFGVNAQIGHGMIAPAAMDADDIEVKVVEVEPQGETGHRRELVIRGARSHLTLVWWDEATAGYGLTQLVAAGGFGGVDWEAWDDNPEALNALRGQIPLEDYRARSQICREIAYARRTDLPGIVFDERPAGLTFCGDVPTQPFYAEGVVLAYLLWPRPAGEALTGLVTSGTTIPQLDAELAYERLVTERVEDIQAHLLLPLTELSALSAVGGVTTPVCVELAERANPSVRRWVVFTLRYLRTEGPAHLVGRWTVSSARGEPAPPVPSAASYCTEVLARSAP